MSELSEDLLAPTLTKKRVIGVIIVAVLLVSLLATSTYFVSLIFDSQRDDPSKELSDADYETLQLVMVEPPFDLDDLDLTDEELEALMEMLDGEVDELPLPAYAALIAALLLSDEEAFRVYEYDSFTNLQDILWRQECFDEYNGQSWDTSSVQEFYDFYSYNDYLALYSSQDLMRIKMELSPTQGPNSFVLRNQFPIPYIMEDSVSSPNLEVVEMIFKNDLDTSTINLHYTESTDVNMSYDTFGQYIPTDSEINISSLDVDDINSIIRNRYLQLPSNYMAANIYVKSTYDDINATINIGDNVFTIADKIRNHLESTFIFTPQFVTDDPVQPGDDMVNRFLENGGGLWSDFASAFCVLSRLFNVPSRFVDGFNGLNISEYFDTQEGQMYSSIKYKNIYNWAEIYVPTITGGKWAQIDIYPTNEIQYNVILTSNATFSIGRNKFINYTAELSSATQPVNGKTITFTDLTTGDFITRDTDINGIANIIQEINESQIIGPHSIEASHLSIKSNSITYVVYGPVEVVLNNVVPQEVNISDGIPDMVNVQGYVIDPVYNDYVKFADIEFLLFEKGTVNQVNAFIPSPAEANTGSNGFFDELLTVDAGAIADEYELRVDFNGSWLFKTYNIGDLAENSSNLIDFNITEESYYDFKLSIDGIVTNEDNPDDPMVLKYFKDGEYVNLSTTVRDGDGLVVSGEEVRFYDFTNGDILIGIDFTDAEGNASILYGVGSSNKSGPTLVYAMIGIENSYSYYVFNESINFDFISGPIPREINVDTTPPFTFDTDFRLVDNSGDPINFTHVNLEMWSGINDRSFLLTPASEFFSITNVFSLTTGVLGSTPVGNYSLSLSFKGVFNYASFTNYPHYFSEGEVLLNADYNITNKLKVMDPQDVSITFKIDDKHALDIADTYDNNNFWTSYNSGENITFEVWINQSGDYADAGSKVRVIDSYTSNILGVYTFTASDNGYHKFVINTSNPIQMHSGLHLIKVTFENINPLNTVNYTYIYINESFSISASTSDSEVLRNIDMFTISGFALNGTDVLRGVNVTLLIFNETFDDVSNDFIFITYNITADDGSYSFSVLPKWNCSNGNYKFIVHYGGSIRILIDASNPLNIIMYDYNFINVNSSIIEVNVTAGSIINEDSYYTEWGSDPIYWSNTDILYIIGNLTFDDGSIYNDMYINVTVQGSSGTVIAYNDTVKTSIIGYFNVTITIGLGWPIKSNTKIIVYFDPIYNGEDFVEPTEITFT